MLLVLSLVRWATHATHRLEWPTAIAGGWGEGRRFALPSLVRFLTRLDEEAERRGEEQQPGHPSLLSSYDRRAYRWSWKWKGGKP
jgi:hypothetical protein